MPQIHNLCPHILTSLGEEATDLYRTLLISWTLHSTYIKEFSLSLSKWGSVELQPGLALSSSLKRFFSSGPFTNFTDVAGITRCRFKFPFSSLYRDTSCCCLYDDFSDYCWGVPSCWQDPKVPAEEEIRLDAAQYTGWAPLSILSYYKIYFSQLTRM